MNDDKYFQFTTGVIGYPILFVLSIWIVFWFEIRFGFDFNHFGILPRTIEGLRGIVFSPLIHGDLTHLWHNTLPLLILSSALFYFYPQNVWRVLLVGTLLTGLFTWLGGRSAHHIGASGVIYMLFAFLFFKGVITKHFRLLAVSFVVVFVYGSMIWYAAPIDPDISWEGHLSGLIAGVTLAFVIRKGVIKTKVYHWESSEYNPEEDEFLKHFDEHGNFIENLPEDQDDFIIQYEYINKEDLEEE